MKIVIITETFLPATDGVVTRLIHAIDYMLECGHEVLIYAPEMEDMPIQYKDALIIPFKAVWFPFYRYRPWAIPTTDIQKQLAIDEPDIVHSVNPVGFAAAGIHYAVKMDIPLVASFHTNVPQYLSYYHLDVLSPVIWSYLRHWHNLAAANMVTSQAMYDLLNDNAIENLVILPKGVDLDLRDPKFYSDYMRQRLTADPKRDKLLLFVGRVAAEKEIDTLLPWLEARDDVNLAIVGDGPEKAALEEKFAHLPVTFTGFLHGEELSAAYASADAFIFPSVSETLGLVITEAMASGLPVIAAESAPTKEQIKHLENGLIYQQGDKASLDQCLALLDQEEVVENIVAKGQDYAQQFSWKNASRAMVDVYESVLEKQEMK
ncbi:glycosyltransferase family 4 protein [Aerococcus urinae]|uniref:glycosyltransferase family 4 protein n=1 Tax=Aerococcus urinae TaxID=1376 RepID=UPI0018E1764D|nr:glycosyltransferase family 1 protein [Aerococcus urinae]